jgi:GT2 family glycosyltransferase
MPPLVSILLVNYNGIDVVLDCLRSLQQHLHTVSYEVIVVDNNSQDGSPDLIAQQFPQVRLLRLPENLGFGAGNNAAAKIARGEFLLLLNTDTQLISDILPSLVGVMKERPEVGIVGPKLLNPDGSLQLSTAWEIGIRGEYKTLQQHRQYASPKSKAAIMQRFEVAREVDVVVGAALFIRRAVFDQLNGFDEHFFMYCEESDLCQRAREWGWKVLYTPDVALIHVRGHSITKLSDRMAIEYRRSQLYYYQKHRPQWEQAVLRFYLLMKFSLAWLRSPSPLNRRLITLALQPISPDEPLKLIPKN